MKCNVNKISKPLKVIDLSIAEGRKRQSSHTGLISLCYRDANSLDTIPLYENFCFIFALFRQKTTESVLEGKALLVRLLAFQAPEGNFPTYLHEFPCCWDPYMGLRIAPILVQIGRHFGLVLSEELRYMLQIAISKVIQSAKSHSLPPIWEHRLSSLMALTRISDEEIMLSSSEDWFEWLITTQLSETWAASHPIPYHRTLQAFIGGSEVQEKGEPCPVPVEWPLAEAGGFSKRLLRSHPSVLRAAALLPIETSLKNLAPYSQVEASDGVRWLWGESILHSLSAPKGFVKNDPQKIFFRLHYEWPETLNFERAKTPRIDDFELAYPSNIEQFATVDPSEFSRNSTPKFQAAPGMAEMFEMGRGDLIEAALFCNFSPDTNLTIEGKRGTIFSFKDQIWIQTPELSWVVQFELGEGNGDFVGQISRGNRPAQKACKGDLRYEAFDWQISLRTLRRTKNCEIIATVRASER